MVGGFFDHVQAGELFSTSSQKDSRDFETHFVFFGTLPGKGDARVKCIGLLAPGQRAFGFQSSRPHGEIRNPPATDCWRRVHRRSFFRFFPCRRFGLNGFGWEGRAAFQAHRPRQSGRGPVSACQGFGDLSGRSENARRRQRRKKQHRHWHRYRPNRSLHAPPPIAKRFLRTPRVYKPSSSPSSIRSRCIPTRAERSRTSRRPPGTIGSRAIAVPSARRALKQT
jgi:hypothetical protein